MIEVTYESSDLKLLLEDDKKLMRKLKDTVLVKKTMQRIRSVHSVNTMADIALIPALRLHALKDDLSGLYSLDIPDKTYGTRIIFIPLNGADISQLLVDVLPPNPALSTITHIHILDRCDDHKKADKDNLKAIYRRYKNN